MVERTYTSPLLTPEDLFFTLSQSLRLPITSPAELARPVASTTCRLYQSLIELCYGGHPISLKPLTSKSNKTLLDLSDDVKHGVLLYPLLNDLLSRLKSDVSLELRDLIAPNEDRTRKIMSDLVNFLRYRADEELLLAETEEMRKISLEEEEIATLKRKIDTLKSDIEENKARKQEFDLPISAKKQKLMELETDRRQMEEEKLALEAEIQQLTAQNVQDPEVKQLHVELAAAKAKENELFEHVNSLKSAMADLQSISEMYSEYKTMQEIREKLLKDVEEKRTLVAETSREIGEIEGNFEDFSEDSAISELQNALKMTEIGNLTLQERLEKQEKSHEMALESIRWKQEELMRLIEACRREIGGGSEVELAS